MRKCCSNYFTHVIECRAHWAIGTRNPETPVSVLDAVTDLLESVVHADTVELFARYYADSYTYLQYNYII